MIAGSYILSALLLFGTALLFLNGMLNAVSVTACWAVVLFYAIGTAAGGISGPLLFASLVSTGKLSDGALAFSVGAAMMIIGGIAEIFLGVQAEQQSLEDIARPLTAIEGTGPGPAQGQAS
jgi:hypothetical protein